MTPLRLIACAALALNCFAQNMPDLARILTFETDHTGAMPGGWSGGPPETIAVDGNVVHGGKWSVRIERREGAQGSFSTITKGLPMDFTGNTIVLRGYLRTENVSGFAGLWAREDGDTGSLAFDNMQQRQLHGTTDWTEYTITLPIRANARQLVFGVLMSGTGIAWADDLELLVDGKPIWEAPKVERPKTPLDLDHEFDHGSGVAVSDLSSVQVANLAALGKVWGFLKYHHPQVVSGQRHWDYDLFRALPKILASADRPTANKAMLDWISALGPVPPCSACVTLEEKDLALHPDLAWLSDENLLGPELSKSLLAIYADRLPDKQFYISLAPNVSNPSFDHEPAYAGMKIPDAGYQLLALYRFWNIIEYWSPNRDIVGENWDDVLTKFIPRVALAKDPSVYTREIFALIALDHDTHANLWSSLALRPPEGNCELPVTVRFVENRAVVTGYSADAAKTSGLQIGDVITGLDGVPVTRLIEEWTPYYAASNDPTRLRDIARSLPRGACGEVRVSVLRGKQESDVRTPRVPASSLKRAGATHDLAGDSFRLLSPDVAYLKLSSVKTADVPHYIDSAAGTKGLIVDLRNYPSEFVVFALGRLLVDRETPFVEFTQCDLSNPGAFHWVTGPPLVPAKPHYSGKVVVLVDEVTQSQAEYTTMALRSAPRTTVIGSTTAGADGNVSSFSLPGGLSTMISGLGIFYPDRKPTQRVGIVPDVGVKPTIAGILLGQDELLEDAIRQILGEDATPEMIARMLAH